jgi:release factor glutamine methyltransferase
MSQVQNLLINNILKTEDKIYFNKDLLSLQQQLLLQNYLDKIASGYPVDYILGEVHFCGQKFLVNEGVFLPRWETEWWTTEIIKAKKLEISIFNSEIIKTLSDTNFVLEIGVGSGIIGLSLAAYFDTILGLDINSLAIDLSKKNQEKLHIKNYQIVKSDLFQNFDIKTKLPQNWVLIANLPYVPMIDYPEKIKNKIVFEPDNAIFSGQDGLQLFKQVIEEIKLNPPQIAFFELDPRNIHTASKLAKMVFKTQIIYTDPDKLERLLVCKI